ncbi:PAAR-like domain-containing protein [Myxococcus sp. AB036A]|uniref:PAAR-like domain-containing protein n=1 Tax=Myxococcus sp. AB036A TaxID=2562793 RepID=UPI0011463A6B|nr:PAAR-like domain-containing protein [Myxococcus sp. AB036A]
MAKVTVNFPRTPVTQGSAGVAAATLPNVCKMPGPPAPFVPTPLPNIGNSSDSPEGYSKTVTINGHPVAIAGASFGSKGDMASKGTGGGLVSSNTHGPTKFIGPGSMNVKIEGRNVQLLGDPMLNNCGPSGSPANAATMTGIIQASGVMTVIYGDDIPCALCGQTHPLEAGEETQTAIAALFERLQEALAAQKQQVLEFARLDKEEKRKDSRLQELVTLNTEERRRAGKGLKAEQRTELERLPGELSTLRAQLAPLGDFFKRHAVLRYSRGSGTHSKGYMIGAMVCTCTGKKLVACSGHAPPGFLAIVISTGFECVSPPVGSKAKQEDWDCAARRIMENHGGHKPKQLIERLFYPAVEGIKPDRGPRVKFWVRIEGLDDGNSSVPEEREQIFSNGESVPSCSECQQKLPAMYCKASCA